MTGRLRSILAGLLLVYPAWLLPGLGSGSLLVLLAVFAASAWAAPALAARLAPPDDPAASASPASAAPSRFDHRLFWTFAAISVVLRAAGANLPVIPVSDAQIHQGTPAVAWFEISSRIPYAGFAVAGLALLLAAARRRLPDLLARSGGFLFFLGITLSLFVWGLWNFASILPVEKLPTLQRYPPLGKILAFGGYGLFGIHEAVLPGIQTAFVIATAWILGSWAERLRPGAGIVASAAWLFAPPFLSPAYLGHLEAGTVFFLAATIDGALRMLEGERGATYENYLAAFFAGLLYKELQLAAFPIVLFLVLLARSPWRLVAALLGPPIVVALPYLLGSRLHNAPTRLAVEALRNPDAILPTLAPLLWGFGPVVLLLAAAGLSRHLAFAPSRLRARGAWAWLAIGSAFLWISPAWSYLRHATVFFPPVALGLAGAVPDRARPSTVRFLALLAALLGVFHCIPRENELVTLRNFRVHYLPYEEAIAALPDGATVYAPMIVEPSHFYLAKTGRQGRLRYERKLWYLQGHATPTIEGLLAEADRLGASHLLLPRPMRPSWMSPHERLVADHPVWRTQNSGRPGGGWDVGTLPSDLGSFLDAPRGGWRATHRFRLGAGELVLLTRSDTIAR